MDVHDVGAGRGDLIEVLDGIKQPALVIGVESDGLFTISEQYELAEHLHDSEMVVIQSPDGHDGFLLEFEQINNAIISFMQRFQHIKDILNSEGIQPPAQVGEVVKESLFGESEIVNWWGPLMGPGRAFDPTKFFIICCNVLGSPYGTASPVTLNPETNTNYGPEFPLATIRDDVRLHKLILDDLGVKSVAICIGGSMGGMQVLEWSFFGQDYIKTIVPIATSAKHSAWCISWGEAQRQSIYSDPNYLDGYYTSDAPPSVGLAAARMAALLTYRSRNSFESRFGRKIMDKPTYSISREPASPAEAHHQIHNDGHLKTKGPASRSSSVDSTGSLLAASAKALASTTESTDDRTEVSTAPTSGTSTPISSNPSSVSLQAIPIALNKNKSKSQRPTVFSAQNYLRYQGDKFIHRFDANCYISITRKMD
ncbi:homoserine O- acetyltransferase, partial [Entomortierella chlamydospora]